VTAQVKVWKL